MKYYCYLSLRNFSAIYIPNPNLIQDFYEHREPQIWLLIEHYLNLRLISLPNALWIIIHRDIIFRISPLFSYTLLLDFPTVLETVQNFPGVGIHNMGQHGLGDWYPVNFYPRMLPGRQGIKKITAKYKCNAARWGYVSFSYLAYHKLGTIFIKESEADNFLKYGDQSYS